MNAGRLWFLDLLAVIVYTAAAGLMVYADVGGAVRTVFALPLILFVPGYAMLAVLYPAMHDFDPNDRDDATERTGNLLERLPHDYMLEPVERVGLSVVFSIALFPAVVLVSHFTPYGVTLFPILVGLCALIGVLTLAAFVVRWQVPAEKRYAPSVMLLTGFLFTREPSRSRPRRRDDASLGVYNVLFIVTILIALIGFGYMVATPADHDESYTEFHVLTDGVDGETTTWYPDTFTAGEGAEFPVSIVNQEGQDVEYTAVVQLQQVDRDAQSIEIHEQDELEREQISVADGERVNHTLTFEPTMTGDDLRLVVLLYEGDVPDDPSEENAYRAIDFRVQVDG
ncbi:DUF1616 domain-containing protein [Natrononativus amylolyticus]|uniref:DUF1616 domain-containing protein n=1 Tax=Natrononativus amylolyticus TaxID=2963434 RepID=UPI0020CCA773|nr:DUF1616 domain-containing protein [Natrononativus amylolyticus]